MQYVWYQAKEYGLGDRFLSSVQDGLVDFGYRQHPEIFPVSMVECRSGHLIAEFPCSKSFTRKGKQDCGVLGVQLLLRTRRGGNPVFRGNKTDDDPLLKKSSRS
jgi:hypothetical protein